MLSWNTEPCDTRVSSIIVLLLCFSRILHVHWDIFPSHQWWHRQALLTICADQQLQLWLLLLVSHVWHDNQHTQRVRTNTERPQSGMDQVRQPRKQVDIIWSDQHQHNRRVPGMSDKESNMYFWNRSSTATSSTSYSDRRRNFFQFQDHLDLLPS